MPFVGALVVPVGFAIIVLLGLELLTRTFGIVPRDLCHTMGFEHSVVTLFVIPLGIARGARITVYDWWYWNEIPVLIGNMVGGFAIGAALYATYKRDIPARRAGERTGT